MREAEEQKRRAELEAAERERLESYQSEFFGRMREILGNREQVEIVGDRFVFDSEVLFPSGSAQLSEEGREQVARVAALLDDVSDEIPDGIDWVIRVDGHTDDVPISNTSRFADNWELSRRAHCRSCASWQTISAFRRIALRRPASASSGPWTRPTRRKRERATGASN